MIIGVLLACLAPAATPPVREERVGTPVPKVVEPAWVSTFVVGPTSGPPDTPCEGKLETESPGVPGSSPSASGDLDLESFPRVDLKPGAANVGLDPTIRDRALLPLDLAKLQAEPLHGDAEDIAAVRRVFRRAGESDSPVRLGFWGASHIAGEYFTGQLRRDLQTRFGDAGHGFVMPVSPWKGYRASDVNLCSHGLWVTDFDRRSGGRNDGMLGPGGMSVESSAASAYGWVQTTKENPQGREVSRFEVLFLHQPRGGVLRMQVDDAPPVEVPTVGDFGPGAVILKVEPGPHRLTVSPKGDGPVRLVGLNLEREGRGVIVDAMGVNGRTVSSWERWHSEQFAAFYARRPEDLVVLAYGTNEANDGGFTPEGYRARLEAGLQKMRSLFPTTPCLLIGPGDRGKKIRDQSYAIWAPHAQVATIQRELGPRFDCATWDQQAAMGGPGSVLSWWKATPSLMAGDLIHYTAAGYQELARRLLGEVGG